MSKLNRALLRSISFIGAAGFCSYSQAVDWTVSGFGTFGYTYENEDDLAYRRDSSHVGKLERNGSFASDSRLGLQLDVSVNRQWSLTTQLLFDESAGHELKYITDLAFVRYEPNANWNFRAGRVGASAYAASDSRYIDYAHLWVRPPQELYSSIIFNSLDGVGMNYYSNNPDFNWSVSLEYGQSHQKLEVPSSHEKYRTELDDIVSISFEVDKASWHWQLSYAQVGSLSVKHGSSTQMLQKQLEQLAGTNLPTVSADAATLSQAFYVSNERVKYLQAAVSYFDGDWTMQSELFHIHAEKESVPHGYGGYLLVGKAFAQLTPYAIYSEFKPSNPSFHQSVDWSLVNPALGPLQIAGLQGVNAIRIDQSTYSLGVRWDIAPQLAIKAQVDHVEMMIRVMAYGLHRFQI